MKLLKAINHIPTNICVNVERDVLKVLDGDCETPVGVNAKIQNNKLNIVIELFSLDGKKRFYLKSSKELDEISKILPENGNTTIVIKISDDKNNYSFKLNNKRNIDRKTINLLRNKEISAIIG